TEFNAQRYLLLQRGKSPQAQDIALGLDGYHVEVDHQTKSRYGGIKCFELFPDHAVVEFEEDARSLFGEERAIVIEFTLRRRELAQLGDWRAKIFKGHDCFLDRSAYPRVRADRRKRTACSSLGATRLGGASTRTLIWLYPVKSARRPAHPL